MKSVLHIFIVSFFLNLLWENAHVVLYSAYKGGEITQFILMRASLFDAFMTVCFVAPFFFSIFLKRNTWLIIVLGLIIATVNEWYGLSTHRWEYNALMPIVPFVTIGLSPMVQLAVLGAITHRIVKRIVERNVV